MSFMLDTNSCIHLLTATHPALTRRVSECPVGEVMISAIVLAELSVGMARGYGPTAEQLEAFTTQIPVCAFDIAAAFAYSKLSFRRDRIDHLIAAHALSVDAVLITANERDFRTIPGLRVENWTRE
jgi:tRNA(fMet)-specific endonuclease VapC